MAAAGGQTHGRRSVMTQDSTAGPRPRLVVGVDGSEASKVALRWAARLAPSMDADIEAVIVWQLPVSYGWAPAYPEGWLPAADAAKSLERTLDEVFGADRPKDLVATVHRGGASHELITASADASMLIVGSRGHGGFAGLLLGSVSATCAEHASCPVLVVHGDK